MSKHLFPPRGWEYMCAIGAGRGVTLMNLFGIGGVSIMQFGSGQLHAAALARGGSGAAYATLFAFFGIVILAGTLIYLLSRDAPR